MWNQDIDDTTMFALNDNPSNTSENRHHHDTYVEQDEPDYHDTKSANDAPNLQVRKRSKTERRGPHERNIASLDLLRDTENSPLLDLETLRSDPIQRESLTESSFKPIADSLLDASVYPSQKQNLAQCPDTTLVLGESSTGIDPFKKPSQYRNDQDNLIDSIEGRNNGLTTFNDSGIPNDTLKPQSDGYQARTSNDTTITIAHQIIPSSPYHSVKAPEPQIGGNYEKRAHISQWAKEISETANSVTQTDKSQLCSCQHFNMLDESPELDTDISSFMSENEKPETEQSDIFGDTDSIFGIDSPKEPFHWDPSGSLMRSLEVHYTTALFWILLGQISEGFRCSAAGGTTGCQQSPHPQAKDNSPTASQSSKGKRKLHQISHGPDESSEDRDGDDDGYEPVKPVKKPGDCEPGSLRFACPFFKRYPAQCRSCGVSDYENPARVKQHITRKHRRPIYCSRCLQVFKHEDDRDGHVRLAACSVQSGAEWFCVTEEQLRKLRKRSTHKSDRDNWNAIYKILFPNVPLPTSPYLDGTVSEEVNYLREAFLAAAPAVLRNAVEQVIPEELREPYAAEIEERLGSAHAELFESILVTMRANRHSQSQQYLMVGTALPSPNSAIASNEILEDSGVGSSSSSNSVRRIETSIASVITQAQSAISQIFNQTTSNDLTTFIDDHGGYAGFVPQVGQSGLANPEQVFTPGDSLFSMPLDWDFFRAEHGI
jgi:hypothetical protein